MKLFQKEVIEVILNKLRHEVENTLQSTLNKITSFQHSLSTYYNLALISVDANRDHVHNMLKKNSQRNARLITILLN
mgnify:CR=1 FL=1